MSKAPEYPTVDHCPITLQGEENTLQSLNDAHQLDWEEITNMGCETSQRYFAGPRETRICSVHSALLDGYREVLRQFDLAKALYGNVAPGFVTELEESASHLKREWETRYAEAGAKVGCTSASKLIDFLDSHRLKLVVSNDPNVSNDSNHLSRWLSIYFDSLNTPQPAEAQAILDFAFSHQHLTKSRFASLHNLFMLSDCVNNLSVDDQITMSLEQRMFFIASSFSGAVEKGESKEPCPELPCGSFDLTCWSKEAPKVSLVNLSILRPGDIVLMEGFIVGNNQGLVNKRYCLRMEPDGNVKCWFISTVTNEASEDHAEVPAIYLPLSAFIVTQGNPTKESKTTKGILRCERCVIMPGLNKDKSHISLDVTAIDVVGISKMAVIYHH